VSAVTEGTVHVSLDRLRERMTCTERQTTGGRQASSKKTTPDVFVKEHIPNHWNNLKIPDETELKTQTRLWKLLIHQLKHLNILVHAAGINKCDMQ